MRGALDAAIAALMSVPLVAEPKGFQLKRREYLYRGRAPIAPPADGESRQVRRARERFLAKRARRAA